MPVLHVPDAPHATTVGLIVGVAADLGIAAVEVADPGIGATLSSRPPEAVAAQIEERANGPGVPAAARDVRVEREGDSTQSKSKGQELALRDGDWQGEDGIFMA